MAGNIQDNSPRLSAGQLRRAEKAFVQGSKTTEMKKLVFGEGLMTPSLDGAKRFTIRKYREDAHDFLKDETVVGEFKDGLNILLRITANTKKGTFRNLKCAERNLEKNGYWFGTAYFNGLKSYYPDLTWDTTGAVVFFEILKVNGVSVVTLNEHAQQKA